MVKLFPLNYVTTKAQENFALVITAEQGSSFTMRKDSLRIISIGCLYRLPLQVVSMVHAPPASKTNRFPT